MPFDEEYPPSLHELRDDIMESLRSTQFWLGLITGLFVTLFGLLIIYAAFGYDLYHH